MCKLPIFKNVATVTVGAALFVLASSPVLADDNLVVNGSFERPAVTINTFETFNAIDGWETTAGCGIEVQNHVAGSPYKGNQHVELDSNCSSAMLQTLATESDTQYDLCFAYSPRPGVSDNKIRVKWDNASVMVLDRDGTGLADTDWHTYCLRNVKASSNAVNLEFIDESISDSVGGYLDAVSVKEHKGSKSKDR